MLLYEQAHDDYAFDELCGKVAESVVLYPDILALLQEVSKHDHVMAVGFTSGLKRVWEKVLAKAGLSEEVEVIGGNRVTDGYVVTGVVKAALVSHLRDNRNAHVIAFGDSPPNLRMLEDADEAVVVVGDENTRSKSMEVELAKAIKSGLKARQVIFPPDAASRAKGVSLVALRVSKNKHAGRGGTDTGNKLFNTTFLA